MNRFAFGWISAMERSLCSAARATGSLILLTYWTMASGEPDTGLGGIRLPQTLSSFAIEYEVITVPDQLETWQAIKTERLATLTRQLREMVAAGKAHKEAADEMLSSVKSEPQRPSENLDITLSTNGKATLYREAENGTLKLLVLIKDGRTYEYTSVGPRLTVETGSSLEGVDCWPYLPFGTPQVPGFVPRPALTGSSRIYVPGLGRRGTKNVVEMPRRPAVVTTRSVAGRPEISQVDISPDLHGASLTYAGWQTVGSIRYPEAIEEVSWFAPQDDPSKKLPFDRRHFKLVRFSNSPEAPSAFDLESYARIGPRLDVEVGETVFSYKVKNGSLEHQIDTASGTISPSTRKNATAVGVVFFAGLVTMLFALLIRKRYSHSVPR